MYLKKWFHKLRMIEGTNFFDHLSVLKGIMIELEAIWVKIEDNGKMLRLLWSLPTSYNHLLPTLIYEKETMNLEEVISTLLSEERKLSGESNETSNDSTLTIGNWKKHNSKKKGVYWVCGQLWDLKKDCQKVNEARYW